MVLRGVLRGCSMAGRMGEGQMRAALRSASHMGSGAGRARAAGRPPLSPGLAARQAALNWTPPFFLGCHHACAPPPPPHPPHPHIQPRARRCLLSWRCLPTWRTASGGWARSTAAATPTWSSAAASRWWGWGLGGVGGLPSSFFGGGGGEIARWGWQRLCWCTNNQAPFRSLLLFHATAD